MNERTKADPAEFARIMQEGVAHHRAGQLPQAEAAYRRALAAWPGNPDALHLLGVIAQRAGNPDAAVKLISKAIKRSPSVPEYHNNLGEAYRAAGTTDRAMKCYRRAIGLNPDFAMAHNNIGILYSGAGRADKAAAAFRRAIKAEPAMAWAHNNLGNALTVLERPDEAVAAYQQAIALKPDYGEAHNNLGNALKALGRTADAIAAYRRAVESRPNSTRLYTNLGNALAELGKTAEAKTSLHRALEIEPEHAEAHLGLGNLYERIHDFEAARAAADQALHCAAGHAEATLLLARLDRRQGHAEQARTRLDTLLARGGETRVLEAAHTERGRIADELGDYAAAFADFDAANRAKSAGRAAHGMDRNAFAARIARNRRWLTGSNRGEWPERIGDGSDAPIFLVGFPRSGTTLTEQILHAHPHLTGSDELPLIWTLMDEDVAGLAGDAARYPDCLDGLGDADIRALRTRYWSRLRDHEIEIAPGCRFVDKLPLNIVELGFVRRVFPESPVLVALRDPRDVCLSCFMQNFAINQAMVHFLDLGATATLYAAVMDLWLGYRSDLGLTYLEFRYEDLVADVEATARRLLAFIGVPWDDSVLRHAEMAKQRFVSTPSYRDIGRPVSSRAVGRWRNYRDQLGAILPVLDPFVAQFGYPQAAGDDATP